MTQAAILEQTGQALRVTDVDLQPPGPGEVVVEIGATGVCHSDVAIITGQLPAPLPLVPGHEGAGTVVEVGPGVTSLAAGDRVVLSWLAQCGTCFYCRRGEPYLCGTARALLAASALPGGATRISADGQDVRQFCGLGTFARRCVVLADSAIRVPSRLPMAAAALIGCGVLTGFGAAVNTAGIRVGDTVAVLGCGGVGLNAVQGARIAGATTIIAIDRHAERLALATELGATDTVTAGSDTLREVKDLTGRRGADVVLEVAGRAETVRSAVDMARRGGTVVLVGAAPDVVIDDVFNRLVMSGKTIRGCLYGSADVRRDVPRLVHLYEQGKLLLDQLVTESFGFPDINKAVEYAAAEQGARAVVTFS